MLEIKKDYIIKPLFLSLGLISLFITGCNSGASLNSNPTNSSATNQTSQLKMKANIPLTTYKTTSYLPEKELTNITTGNGPEQILMSSDNNYLLVLNELDNSLAVYAKGSNGKFSQSPAQTLSTGANPVGMSITPDNRFIYVVNHEDGNISVYAFNKANSMSPLAQLASIPHSIVGSIPTSIAIASNNQYAYVTSYDSLRTYQINSDGSFTLLSTLPSDGAGITTSQDGRYIYVLNSTSRSVSTFMAESDGTLNIVGEPVNTGDVPTSMIITPNGRYAYIANLGDNTISMYSIGTNGALSPLSETTITTAPHPQSMLATPDGEHIYVASSEKNTISIYNINSSGTLELNSGLNSVPTGNNPYSIILDSTDNYLYVANAHDNTISEYRTLPDKFRIIIKNTSNYAFAFSFNNLTSNCGSVINNSGNYICEIMINRPGLPELNSPTTLYAIVNPGPNQLYFSTGTTIGNIVDGDQIVISTTGITVNEPNFVSYQRDCKQSSSGLVLLKTLPKYFYAYNDAESYLNQLNESNTCGFSSGWRLPTMQEVSDNLCLGRTNASYEFLSQYFNNISSANEYFYWTQTQVDPSFYSLFAIGDKAGDYGTAGLGWPNDITAPQLIWPVHDSEN